MPTTLISFANDGVSRTVASGDKLVMRARNTSGDANISVSIYPAAGATGRVFFTHSAMSLIAANPDDPAIKWLAWANGDITNASADTEKEDTFVGKVKAIKIEATGGAVQVEASL